MRLGHDELEKQKEIFIMKKGFEAGTLQLSRADIEHLFSRLVEVTTRAENAARELERAQAKIIRQGAAIDYMLLPLVSPTVAAQVKKELGE